MHWLSVVLAKVEHLMTLCHVLWLVDCIMKRSAAFFCTLSRGLLLLLLLPIICYFKIFWLFSFHIFVVDVWRILKIVILWILYNNWFLYSRFSSRLNLIGWSLVSVTVANIVLRVRRPNTPYIPSVLVRSIQVFIHHIKESIVVQLKKKFGDSVNN